MGQRRDVATTLALAGVVTLLAACAPTPSPAPQVPAAADVAWPPPPAPARVRFVSAFSTPEELGIGKGFAQRLGELFTGPSERGMVRPMGVAVTPDGVIHVTDPGAQGVHRFDVARGRYRLFRAPGGRPLPSPVGIAAGAKGEVYVTDSSLSQVFILEPGARELAAIPLEGLIDQPTGIAVDGAGGRLFLVDTGSHKVKVYARDGALLGTFGRRGTGPGEFNYPTMIWRDDRNRFLVTDSLNFRVQIFDDRGGYLSQFGQVGGATGHHARPKGVATDSFGHVYVVDSLFHALQVFDEQGSFLLSIGIQGHGPGEFWLPNGIFIGDEETIYVADSYNRRVQVLRYIGGGS